MRGETSWGWLGDDLALDIANTVVRRGQVDQELWVTGSDVAHWTELERDRLAPVAATEADDRLGELHQLRDAVLMLLRAAAAAGPWNIHDVDLVNRYMRTHAVVPQLDPACGTVVHQQLDTVEGGRDRAPVDALLGHMAAATISFLDGPRTKLLACCNAPSCGQLFLRRRRDQQWCCTACGTRARVARHTKRHAL